MTQDHFPPLDLKYQYTVSTDRLFEAWVSAEVMRLWMFKSDTNEIIHIKTKPEAGGSYSLLEKNRGLEVDHYGTYIEVDKPRRLAFTLEVPWHFEGVSHIKVAFHKNDEGCELHFTQSGIDTRYTKANWIAMLERLDDVMRGNV